MQPRRPLDAPQTLGDVVGLDSERRELLDGGNCEPRIVDLVGTVQGRQRQIESRAANIAEAIRARFETPLAPGPEQRRLHLGGTPLDHRRRVRMLQRYDGRHARFHDARLIDGDLRHRIAEKFRVIKGYRRQGADRRVRDDIGRIAAAAESDFE